MAEKLIEFQGCEVKIERHGASFVTIAILDNDRVHNLQVIATIDGPNVMIDAVLDIEVDVFESGAWVDSYDL